MKPADQIPVKTLKCSRCAKTIAWCEIMEDERPPVNCYDCSGRLVPVQGQEAVEACLRESGEYAKGADRCFQTVLNMTRHSQAFKIEAFKQAQVAAAVKVVHG